MELQSGKKALLLLKVRNEGNEMDVSGKLNSKQIWSGQKALVPLKVSNVGNQMEVSKIFNNN